jgi:hypothetical protein
MVSLQQLARRDAPQIEVTRIVTLPPLSERDHRQEILIIPDK